MANEHTDCGAWEKQDKLDLIKGGMGVFGWCQSQPCQTFWLAKFLVKNLVARVLANTEKKSWKWECRNLVTTQ